MKYELSIYEVSVVLKALEEKSKLNLVIKRDLSGGWMTIMGEAKVETEAIQGGGCHGKDINILELRVNSDNSEGALVKLTGAKTKKFTIDVASTRYRELSSTTLSINKIKINEDECKLRIDEDMIFTLKASAEEISNIISSNI